MRDVIYWATLGLLWVCIGLNTWTIIRNWRLHRRLIKLREKMDRLWGEIVVLRTRYERMIAYPEMDLTDENE